MNNQYQCHSNKDHNHDNDNNEDDNDGGGGDNNGDDSNDDNDSGDNSNENSNINMLDLYAHELKSEHWAYLSGNSPREVAYRDGPHKHSSGAVLCIVIVSFAT